MYCFLSVQASLELVERFAFYDRAKKAFAVVATGFALFCFFLSQKCYWLYFTTVMMFSLDGLLDFFLNIYLYKCLHFSSVVSTKRDVSVWEPDTEEGGHSC